MTDLAVRDESGAAPMLRGVSLNREQVELLKRTIAADTTDDELALFVAVCNRTGLDPFARQIHAVMRWDNQAKRKVMSIQTGIDGQRLIAERTGKYRGSRAPMWCGPDGVWRDVWLSDEAPAAARVDVLRADFDEPVVGIARWVEFVQTAKDGAVTRMWAQMPTTMLAKCAESQALRKAFPAELSGLYTPEEMGQAAPAVDPPEGFISHEDARDAHHEVAQRIKALAEDKREQVKAWRTERDLPWPMSLGDLSTLCEFLDSIDPPKNDAPDDDIAEAEIVGDELHEGPAPVVQAPSTTSAAEEDQGQTPAPSSAAGSSEEAKPPKWSADLHVQAAAVIRELGLQVRPEALVDTAVAKVTKGATTSTKNLRPSQAGKVAVELARLRDGEVRFEAIDDAGGGFHFALLDNAPGKAS